MDTAKQLKRGYKRNYGTIQAMIAEYQKATGKTVNATANLHKEISFQSVTTLKHVSHEKEAR